MTGADRTTAYLDMVIARTTEAELVGPLKEVGLEKIGIYGSVWVEPYGKAAGNRLVVMVRKPRSAR